MGTNGPSRVGCPQAAGRCRGQPIVWSLVRDAPPPPPGAGVHRSPTNRGPYLDVRAQPVPGRRAVLKPDRQGAGAVPDDRDHGHLHDVRGGPGGADAEDLGLVAGLEQGDQAVQVDGAALGQPRGHLADRADAGQDLGEQHGELPGERRSLLEWQRVDIAGTGQGADRRGRLLAKGRPEFRHRHELDRGFLGRHALVILIRTDIPALGFARGEASLARRRQSGGP